MEPWYAWMLAKCTEQLPHRSLWRSNCLIWYKYKHMVFQTKGVSFPLQVMSLTLSSCPLWDHCREGSITKVWQTKGGLDRIWALSQTRIAFVWDWPELNLDLSYLVSSMQCACEYCLVLVIYFTTETQYTVCCSVTENLTTCIHV